MQNVWQKSSVPHTSEIEIVSKSGLPIESLSSAHFKIQDVNHGTELQVGSGVIRTEHLAVVVSTLEQGRDAEETRLLHTEQRHDLRIELTTSVQYSIGLKHIEYHLQLRR